MNGTGDPGGAPRVLLVTEQLRRRVPGGIGTYVRGVLQGLSSLADPVRVALYASRAGSGPDPLIAYGHRVEVSRLPGPLLTRLWDHNVVRAPRGYDLVHGLSLSAPPSSDATVVMTIHDVAWRHRPEDFPRRGRRWHEAALERALQRAAHFVVPSDDVARDVVGAGARADAVSVISPGSDHLPEADHPGGAAVLDRLGIHGDFLLSVGTIEPRKNLPRLFAAYEAVRSALPEPWPLVVVGPAGWGNQRDRAPGVVFSGRVTAGALAALYARARLLAYVPLEEGFGLPPVEAMRIGTPVLSSPLPSVGSAAWVVDPERVEDLAAGIARVATDEDVRARLIAAGTDHVRGLTWESAAAAHVALWRRLR